MGKAIFCIANDYEQAETIVDRLRVVGFSNDDISVLFPDRSGTKDFAHEKSTKAPEGTVAGAGTGGVVGGTLGYLAGIGALAIPGVGPLIAAGPIMATLSGMAVGGAVGGLTGAMVGMGLPEYEAKRYAGKVKDGNILISAHAEDDDQVSVAKAIFRKAGAEDVSTAGEERTGRKDRRPDGDSRAREHAPPPEERRSSVADRRSSLGDRRSSAVDRRVSPYSDRERLRMREERRPEGGPPPP